jgi:hypothetical protein
MINLYKGFDYNIKGMVVQKEIMYPIFLDCCQHATDIFWENVFEDLAYGKSPYGTYITKDFLCCSYKRKEFSYKIEKKDPKKLYDDVHSLLTNKLGLLSQREKIKKRTDFHIMEENIKDSRQTWTSIRKKNVKDLLIEKYVLEMRRKHSLTIKQARYLLSIIFVAMMFKAITSKDIEYSDGKIQNINGIDFNKRQVILQRDIFETETSFSVQVVNEKKRMTDSWDKFLKDLRKYSV